MGKYIHNQPKIKSKTLFQDSNNYHISTKIKSISKRHISENTILIPDTLRTTWCKMNKGEDLKASSNA